MTRERINVAIVGLGFGAEFIPIYQRHPHANMYAICQRNRQKLDAVGDAFGVETAVHRLRRAAQGPERGRGAHQLARFPTTPGCPSRP